MLGNAGFAIGRRRSLTVRPMLQHVECVHVRKRVRIATDGRDGEPFQEAGQNRQEDFSIPTFRDTRANLAPIQHAKTLSNRLLQPSKHLNIRHRALPSPVLRGNRSDRPTPHYSPHVQPSSPSFKFVICSMSCFATAMRISNPAYRQSLT